MKVLYCLILGLLTQPFQGMAIGKDNPKQVIYKTIDTIELRLHFYLPDDHEGGDDFPAVVFFFGGGWVNGTVKQFEAHCQNLSEAGIIGITAEYRIQSKHGTTPQDAMEDAKSAIRYIRSHSGEFNIDTSRIAAAGGSAGGHLAACAGMVPGFENEREDHSVSSVPNAMILFNPVIKIPPFSDRFGGSEEASKASPMDFVQQNAPPCIIFHGTHDALIDQKIILEFQSEMVKYGNHCEVVLFGGQGHGFFNTNKSNGMFYRRTIALMRIFLQEQGYIR